MSYRVIGLLHPAFILRGQHAKERWQIHTLRRLREWMDSGFPPVIDTDEPPPGCIVEPTFAELAGWFAGAQRAPAVTLDLETADEIIRCIGFVREDNETGVVVWFRKQGGGVYWPWHQLVAITGWLKILFEGPVQLTLQNGMCFDWPIVLKHGFRFRNYTFDTIMGQHMAYPDAPKGLGFMGVHYADLPYWKGMVDVQEGEDK